MTPFKVIGTWKWGPKGRYCSFMGEELTEITANLGLVPFKNDDIQRNKNAAWSDYDLHAEVRMTAETHSEGTGWHQDGDTSTDDMDCALVLWTNRDPTQFKWAHKAFDHSYSESVNPTIYTPEPFQLVIARNLSAYHRRAPGVSGKRFLFRQRVEVPEWL